MPPDTYVYYRGYMNLYPIISDRPSYFGTMRTASSYSNEIDRSMSAFTNTKSMRLVDIRFMKEILRQIFVADRGNDEILSVILSYGLTSLYNQCLLAKMRFGVELEGVKALIKSYKEGIYEQPGVRIAETTNDSYTMAFLKALFDGHFDGFISPIQESVFHTNQDEKIPAEMIIFNPKACGIKILDASVHIPYVVTMDYLYGRQFSRKINIKSTSLYVGGADKEMIPSVEQIAEKLYTDPRIQKEWERGQAAGKRWRKHMDFSIVYNKSEHISSQQNKTRKQRNTKRMNVHYGGSNNVPSVERITEEWDTNPIIRHEWQMGEEAAKRWLAQTNTKNVAPDIIAFDPPITVGEHMRSYLKH